MGTDVKHTAIISSEEEEKLGVQALSMLLIQKVCCVLYFTMLEKSTAFVEERNKGA